MEFLLENFTFDWRQTFIDFLRVAIAFVLAIPIGWERYESDRNLGLRTFPIVAMGACSFMLIAKYLPEANAEAQARAIQGLLSGIGFIGGGAILKHNGSVRGLATATSIWCTGAIGAAVAFEREGMALMISIVTFCTLRLLTPIAEEEKEDFNSSKSDEEKKDNSK